MIIELSIRIWTQYGHIDWIHSKTRQTIWHRRHIVTKWEGPSTERRLWSRIWCKAGHCDVQSVLPFSFHLSSFRPNKNENSDLSAFHEMTTIWKVFFLLIVSKAFASCYHSDARGKHIRIISQSVEMSCVDAEKNVNPGRCSGHFGWAALSTNRRWWGSSGYEKYVQNYWFIIFMI